MLFYYITCHMDDQPQGKTTHGYTWATVKILEDQFSKKGSIAICCWSAIYSIDHVVCSMYDVRVIERFILHVLTYAKFKKHQRNTYDWLHHFPTTPPA